MRFYKAYSCVGDAAGVGAFAGGGCVSFQAGVGNRSLRRRRHRGYLRAHGRQSSSGEAGQAVRGRECRRRRQHRRRDAVGAVGAGRTDLRASASTSALAINPSLYGPKLSYQPDKDLQPVVQISVVPNVLVVNPDKIKARTLPDLIAYLKANPDKVSFGSAGVGTSQHLAGELFQQMTGTKMVHVPYKGSSTMLTDLISGQIDLAFDNVPLLLPQAKDGKLALIAAATPKRASFDPESPHRRRVSARLRGGRLARLLRPGRNAEADRREAVDGD